MPNLIFMTVTRLWPLDSLKHTLCRSAYSEERWRMVWQKQALGYTCAKIAQNLCIDKSTVSRILKLLGTNGSVSKRPYPKDRAFRKPTTPAQLLIASTPMLEKPRNLPRVRFGMSFFRCWRLMPLNQWFVNFCKRAGLHIKSSKW